MARPPCLPVEIIATPPFVRDVDTLRKKYRSVDAALFESLKTEIGPEPTCGWLIPGRDAPNVYKLRLPNKDIGSGKSRGFRLIYEWHAEERRLWLLRLYTHEQMDDISSKEIKKARQAAGLK